MFSSDFRAVCGRIVGVWCPSFEDDNSSDNCDSVDVEFRAAQLVPGPPLNLACVVA